MNQVRKFEGKLDRYGMDNRLHATVKLLDDKTRSLRFARSARQANKSFGQGGLGSAPKTICFSDVHNAALLFARRTNLWGDGPLREWKKARNGPELPAGASPFCLTILSYHLAVTHILYVIPSLSTMCQPTVSRARSLC